MLVDVADLLIGEPFHPRTVIEDLGAPPGPGNNGAPMVNIENFHNNTGNPNDGQSAGRDLARIMYAAPGHR